MRRSPPNARRVAPCLVVALIATLTGCAAGPDYVRPDIATAGTFVRAETGDAEGVLENGFWERFGDAQLAALVDHALSANHDLRIGLARLEQARALWRQSRFDRLPTITASADAADLRSSAAQLPGAPRADRDAESYAAGIHATWELDLFGRVRRQVESQRAQADAVRADLAALQVAVVAELTGTYVELRGLQSRLRVTRANADAQRDSLHFVEVRLDAGRGTEFDSARARAQFESTLARIPALETSIAAAMHRIAVLSGRTPDALIGVLETDVPVLVLDEPIANGTPGDLLRRRPDIAAAERRLAAATAGIGIATADLFPRFTLGGLIGSQALRGGDLFGRDSETRTIALGIDWSFLDIGRVRTRIAAADANAAAALAAYEQAVLRALEETENALVRRARARDEREHLREAAVAGARAAELARIRFDGGVVDFLQVLDAERSRLEAEDQLAQGQTRAALAVIAVYSALAGGWPAAIE